MGGSFLLLGMLLIGATAATFELDDDLLRRNSLNLLAAVAVLCWCVSAVVMRFEMSRVFDIRRLLPLPVQFRALYALRVGAGLSGLWIPLFGPSLLYLLLTRTAGVLDFAVAVLAALACVILLGRLVAVVLLKLDNLNASWVATAVFLLLVVLALFAVEPVMKDRALDLTDQPIIDLIAEQVRESRLLAAAGYLPGGLLAGIFDAPRELGANLTRLAGLWLAALLVMVLEYRILRGARGFLQAGADDVGGVHFPLARLLRRSRRMTPKRCLSLIEFESCMRLKWFRGLALPGVFLAPLVQTGSLFGIFWCLVIVGFFLGLRNNTYGIAHRSIGERFGLPVRQIDFALAHHFAMRVFPAIIFSAAVLWAWQRVGWPGLDMFGLWLALPFCLLVAGDGFGAYASVRWPYKLDLSLYTFQPPPGPVLLAWLPLAAGAIGVPFGLEFLAEHRSWGPRFAVYGALALMAGAVVLRVFGSRAADRRLRADPHRVLDLLANRKDEVREAA